MRLGVGLLWRATELTGTFTPSRRGRGAVLRSEWHCVSPGMLLEATWCSQTLDTKVFRVKCQGVCN